MTIRLAISILALLIMGCDPVPSEPSGASAALQNPYVDAPFRLGAMGDSISRGYNQSTLGSEDLTTNWSTGDNLPQSQFNHVKEAIRQRGWDVWIQGRNVAVVGETVLGNSSTLSSQAMNLSVYQPDYVTLQIGVNDVCQGYVATASARVQFRDRVAAVLRLLTQSSKPPKAILVASMPRVWSLREIPQYAQSSFCQISWSLLCPQMSAGKAAFEQQWQATNQALLDAVAMVGGSVVYDGGLTAASVLGSADVSSVDCFHPSLSGQARLSAAAWTAIEPKLNSVWNNSN